MAGVRLYVLGDDERDATGRRMGMGWTNNVDIDLHDDEGNLLAWIKQKQRYEVYIVIGHAFSGYSIPASTETLTEAKAYAEYGVAYYRVTGEIPTLEQYHLLTKE
jgi:hypothetical protein